MKYAVDIDNGTEITGWLIGDNQAEASVALLLLPDRDPIEIHSNTKRGDLVDLGLAQTDQCGFRIDESIVPTLAGETRLELRDAATGILFHRRTEGGLIQSKLAILENCELPRKDLFSLMSSRFLMPYDMNEIQAFDTVEWVLRYPHHKSVVANGKINYTRHASALRDSNYIISALLHDPFEQFAEKLAWLKLVARSREASESEGLEGLPASLFEFAATLPLDDPPAIARALRQLPREAAEHLRDPMTRMLASNVGERATRSHVTQALDFLATMDAVGTSNRIGDFAPILADRVGADVLSDYVAPSWKVVTDLAAVLSRVSQVQTLLENDLALYSYVEEAVQATP